MIRIFVNLKRFEVSREKGGLCSLPDPITWVESVITDTVELGLGQIPDLKLAYMLPEGLVAAAVRSLEAQPEDLRRGLSVGVQGVHWQDIRPGQNFGAFTTSLPAAAALGLGSQWAIIGHSEERRAKLQVMQAFEPQVETDAGLRLRASRAVDQLVAAEAANALHAGLNVLLCIGETAEERGGQTEFEQQKPHIERVLKSQLLTNLGQAVDFLRDQKVVIGYEPVWAIGPGRTPPGKEYIAFVSAFIKQTVQERFGYEIPVVYGGGLKEENAAMIASIETLDGGLVGLTRFTGEIGFDVPGLKGIIEKYRG
jgi:triosephosphate isomerase (TIM)